MALQDFIPNATWHIATPLIWVQYVGVKAKRVISDNCFRDLSIFKAKQKRK
jgi:hypothetical protein